MALAARSNPRGTKWERPTFGRPFPRILPNGMAPPQPAWLQARVALLELRDVTKAFGATIALREINLKLEAGRFHALLGENGAGKSTLIKILAGIHRSNSRRDADLRANELKRQRPRCCARLDSILFTRILPSFQA